jgi:hypothetical protein
MKRLLELVRQLESAAPHQQPALAETLKSELHAMIPDRLGDAFQSTLEAAKAQRLPQMRSRYLKFVIERVLFAPEELSALNKLFPSDLTASVDSDALGPLLDVLQTAESSPAVGARKDLAISSTTPSASGFTLSALKSAFARSAPPPSSEAGKKGRSSRQTYAVTRDEALQLLACYPPFAVDRAARLETMAAEAVRIGDTDGAKKFLKRMNDVNEHIKVLQRNAEMAGGPDGFIALTAVPEVAV